MRARGFLYEPGSSQRIEAMLARDGDGFRLTTAGDDVGRPVEIRSIGDRLAGVAQAVTLDTGQRFVPFEELPAGFLGAGESGASRWIDWLERFSPLKAAVLVVLFALGILGLRAAVPVAADLAVALIPQRLEAAIGGQAFREIDAVLLEPSKLAPDRRARLMAAARSLAQRGGIDPVPKIHFRDSPEFGANALALPGGPILVTDDLVRVLGDDRKILAVIAHEFGHIQERHGLRQVLRIAGVFLIASLVVGADDTLMEELAALAVSLSSSGYSKDFERDADAFAGRLLARAGRPPGDLADALQALLDDCGRACETDDGWFSTHPAIGERIKVIRAAP